MRWRLGLGLGLGGLVLEVCGVCGMGVAVA